MNGVLIAVIVILMLCMAHGYWRGFLRIAFSLLALILTFVLVSWATPYISGFIKDNTSIYQDIEIACANKVQLKVEEKTEGELELLDVDASIPLPKVWAEELLQKTGDTVNQLAEENGVYQKVGSYIADWVLKGIAFFVAFVVVSIVLKLIVGLLDIIAKIPVIKGVNRFLGIIVGLVQGMLIIWLLMFLVAIACTSQAGQYFLSYIEQSTTLTFLYENNLLIYVFSLFG